MVIEIYKNHENDLHELFVNAKHVGSFKTRDEARAMAGKFREHHEEHETVYEAPITEAIEGKVIDSKVAK